MPRTRVTTEYSHEFFRVADPDQFVHLLYLNGRHYQTHVFTEIEMIGFRDLLTGVIDWETFCKAVDNEGRLYRQVYDAQKKVWSMRDFLPSTPLHPWTPYGWYRGQKYKHLTLFELRVDWQEYEGDCKTELYVSANNPCHAGRGLNCSVADRSRLLDAIQDALSMVAGKNPATRKIN